MKNELQILIEELQREHDYLEGELNACIKEWDFEGAEAFKEPLFYTREKLRILKNLENRDYDKIVGLRGKIERLKNYEAKDGYSKFAIQRMKDKIPEYEKELSNLENKEKQFHYDSDELTICFEKIVRKEIKEFELEVESEGLVFEMSEENSNLKIEIRRTDKYSLDYTTTRKGLAELKRMGFLVEDKHAVKKIEAFEEKKILPTIELFSRIACEVFRLYGDKKGKIKLKNESSS